MPLPRTSKEKSARIDWGYVQRPVRLARVRSWLWALAALLIAAPLTAATVTAGLTGTTTTPLATVASRGPLVSSHAAWEGKCETCHIPFAAVRTSADKCETCHAPAAHHPNQKPTSVAGCADCHRDHQGRTASLVRLADETCVRCHGALKDHWQAPSSAGTVERVSAFASPPEHPEFRAAQPDGKHVRTLKFSHATHMTAGMGVGTGWTFSKIEDAAVREQFKNRLGQTDSLAVVQLECRTCHQLEADGRTYKSVNFEAHCRACHPLTFDDAPAMKGNQAPHHVQPEELDRFLRQVYTERFVAEEWKAKPELDRGPSRLDPPPAVVTAARGKIDAAVTAALQTLFTGRTTCLECHDAYGPSGQRLPKRIIPVKLSQSWMPHARFDHTAHRSMECQHCHPGATEPKAKETAAAQVWARSVHPDAAYQHRPDLPGIANCRQCHSPAGGVRHDCTDCHRYHGPGTGTPAHPFPTAADWLRGR